MRSQLRISVASVGLAVLSAGAAGAQEPAVAGPCAKPDSVAFRGNARVAESALRGDVAVVAGTTINYRALQRAIKSLYATAQFEDIQVKCEVSPLGRVLLVFDLKERPLLGEVDVTGPEPRVTKGRVPRNAVVIPGSWPKAFPAGTFHVPCALVIGRRKASTDLKTSLEDALREHDVAV